MKINTQVKAKESLPYANIDALKAMEESGINSLQYALYTNIEWAAESVGGFPQSADGGGAHYMTENPFAAQGIKCSNCLFYEGGGACEVVLGEIGPDAVCKFWIIPDRLLTIAPAPVQEAAATDVEEAIAGEYLPISEAKMADGKMRVRVIAPGQGSSGFYPQEVLRRDGPKVFVKGTKMYADHPTESEGKARPERSIRDIVGTLTEDATYEESGPAGPGLYADINVMPEWRDRVEALAPHIGVSIRTRGSARMDVVEGKRCKVIESLERTPFTSVDFVTEPGAGGRILNELYESVSAGSKTAAEEAADSNQGETHMEENLQESAALRIAKLCNIAGKPELIAQYLEEKKTPDQVAEMLLEAKAKEGDRTNISSHHVATEDKTEGDSNALVKIAEARAEAYHKGGK